MSRLSIFHQNNHVETLRALTETGADMNKRMTDGSTALDLVTQKENSECDQLLRDAGAAGLKQAN